MFKVESYKKGIILSTFFNILNKGLVFLNGLLVVYFFGSDLETDIFFYLYNSVLILGAFFTSINSSVLIPESMRIREQQGSAHSMAFLNFFLYGYALLSVLVVAAAALSPVELFSFVSKFKDRDLMNSRYLLITALPLFGMICIINLLIDIFTSYRFFTIPMVVGIINSSISIFFMSVFHEVWSIQSVLLGLLAAYTINILLLLFFIKKFLKWKFSLAKLVKESRIWRNLLFAQLGNITSTASSYTPMYILSGFSAGIITALTFAQQISSLPTMLITYQFSAVAGIKFNELYAKRDFSEINAVFSRTANFLHYFMIPVSLILFLFTPEAVSILAGVTSFSAGTAEYIIVFLKYLSLCIPLLVINSLIARLFMASHKIKESFWYQIVFNVVLISALYLLVKQLGIIGYPAAILGAYLVNILFCYFIERHYFNFIQYKKIIYTFLKIILVNAVIATSVYLAICQINITSPMSRLFLGSVGYGLLLLVSTYLFKFNSFIADEFYILFRKSTS